MITRSCPLLPVILCLLFIAVAPPSARAATPNVVLILADEQELQALRDEIQRMKGTTQRPKISPSRLLKPPAKPDHHGKRPGSAKRSNTKHLRIDETIVIQPAVSAHHCQD